MIDTTSLRKKIIELALQGAFTPEVEKKEVDALIESINKQRTEFLRRGIIKKWKVLSDIKKEELLFDTPMNWAVKRMGEICLPMSDGIHYAPPYLEVGYPCFSAKDIFDDKIHLENCTYISDEEYLGMKEKINVNEGSLLITKSGSIGRSAIVENYYEFGLVESIGVINPITVKSAYLKIVLDYGFVYSNRFVEKYTRGVGLKHLTLTLLENIPIPIPSLEIQEMIIEKIYDVFKILDTIDELQKSYISDVNVLKNKLIEAGIQGKLTEQLSEDGTAEELFAEIQMEKQQLIKEKKIKKEKALADITEDEIPFEIPNNWKWVRLADISNKIWAGGDKPDDFTKMASEDRDIPVVANGVTDDGILGYTSVAKAPAETITVAGRGTIGFCTYRNYEYCPIVRLIVIEPSPGIDPKYLKVVMQALQESSVGSSIPQLTVPMIKPKLIPLPPYAEQMRIVEKLDELLAVI